MGSEVIIVPILFGVIFGIIYLYFSTRNKERMALIEKGIGADIFNKGKRSTAPGWKVFILNFLANKTARSRRHINLYW